MAHLRENAEHVGEDNPDCTCVLETPEDYRRLEIPAAHWAEYNQAANEEIDAQVHLETLSARLLEDLFIPSNA